LIHHSFRIFKSQLWQVESLLLSIRFKQTSILSLRRNIRKTTRRTISRELLVESLFYLLQTIVNSILRLIDTKFYIENHRKATKSTFTSLFTIQRGFLSNYKYLATRNPDKPSETLIYQFLHPRKNIGNGITKKKTSLSIHTTHPYDQASRFTLREKWKRNPTKLCTRPTNFVNVLPYQK
jgi:hypothetical protein